jgi:hypothetical protein
MEFTSILTQGIYFWWVSYIDASDYDLVNDTWKIDRFYDVELLNEL